MLEHHTGDKVEFLGPPYPYLLITFSDKGYQMQVDLL